MKRILFSAVLVCGALQNVGAQVIVNDTVITGPNYANTMWYSLENDEHAPQPSDNWHIGLSTSVSPTSGVAASVLFNHKMGTVYAIPNSSAANFATVDTAGLSTWTPLYNSDVTWAEGAFNSIATGHPDYGWGEYAANHTGISASRVFVLKLTGNVYKKIMFDLTWAGGYTLKYANLDNTDLQTQVVPLTAYASKNFVYYSVTTNTVLDREPASEAWDLTFTQYPTLTQGVKYTVAGILHNHGVEVAKVRPVNDTTYMDWSQHTFSEDINTIGYNWKNAQAGTVEDSTVFFIKAKDGALWKVVMTGFVGAAGGKYYFRKQKLSALGVNEMEAEEAFMTVYPNPANESVSLVLDNADASDIKIYSLTGSLVYTTTVAGNGLQHVQVPVATFSNGLYQVICTSKGKTITQKLVVQH